jgi:hypothetical protein
VRHGRKFCVIDALEPASHMAVDLNITIEPALVPLEARNLGGKVRAIKTLNDIGFAVGDILRQFEEAFFQSNYFGKFKSRTT